VKLHPFFDIKLDGVHAVPHDLQDAISRTKRHLQNDKFERLIVGRGAGDRNGLENAPSLSTLELSFEYGDVQSIMDEATKPIGTRIEGYTLSIPETGGTAKIAANSTLGLLHGLTTFEQLFYFDGDCTIYTYEAPVSISDIPAYASTLTFRKSKLTSVVASALPRIHAGYVSQLVRFCCETLYDCS
jgi:hexosaminidase